MLRRRIGPWRVALVFLLLCASSLNARSARADGRRIGVFVRTRYPELRGLATEMQAHARHWVSRQEGLDLAQLYASVHPEPTAAGRRALQDATEAVELGRDAWLDGRLSDALGPLSKAVQQFSAQAALLESVGPYVQALQLLGGIHLKEGKRKEAIRVLSKAMALDPEAALDPELFSPETCKLYESGQAKAKATRGKLRVSSEPPGAMVFVDGRPAGPTPLETTVRVVGRHSVRVVRDTHHPAGASVVLRSAGPAELDVALEPIRQAQAFRNLIERAMEEAGLEELMADHAISELGAALEVSELVLFRVVATTEEQVLVEGYQYDFLDGQLINLGDRLMQPTSPKLGEEVGRFVDDIRAARTDMSLGDSVPLAPVPEGASYGDGVGRSEGGGGADDGGSILGSPWLWVGIGGAAAAAGGAAAVVLLAGDDESEPSGPAPAASRGRVLFGFE